MFLVRITLVGILSAVGIWQSLSYRLGGYYPSDFAVNKDEREQFSLPASWQYTHPDTWIKLSNQSLGDENFEEARKYAINGLMGDITSGRAASQLLNIYDRSGNLKEADLIAEFTTELWPSHSYVRSRLADYWLKRNNLKRTLAEWNVLMMRSHSLDKFLFPKLAQIIKHSESAAYLTPYILNPPIWWERFFAYILKQKNTSLDSIKFLYQIRIDSDIPLSNRERKAFISRLINESQWQEAYFSWMGGLEPKQLNYGTSLLFDGGFESDSNNTGFDWNLFQHKMASIKTERTFGMKGKKALSILLKDDSRINFNNVHQNIILKTGVYELKGRYRIDTLKAEEGLRWRVRCIENNSLLGESVEFIGRSPWRVFKLEFSVPNDGCEVQSVRLEASSSYAHKHRFQGKLWFDDMSIYRQIQ